MHSLLIQSLLQEHKKNNKSIILTEASASVCLLLATALPLMMNYFILVNVTLNNVLIFIRRIPFALGAAKVNEVNRNLLNNIPFALSCMVSNGPIRA